MPRCSEDTSSPRARLGSPAGATPGNFGRGSAAGGGEDRRQAIAWLARGGEQAERIGALRAAVEHYLRAADVAGEVGGPSAEAARLGLAAVPGLIGLGRLDEAAAALERWSAPGAGEGASPLLLRQVAMHRAHLAWAQGLQDGFDPVAAEGAAETLLERLGALAARHAPEQAAGLLAHPRYQRATRIALRARLAAGGDPLEGVARRAELAKHLGISRQWLGRRLREHGLGH